MERKETPPDQLRRNNERARVRPYLQLAADIAELQDPGASIERPVNHEAITNVDGRTENVMDIRQEPRDQTQGRNERQRGNPYHQLATDMAQPLADLQVPGASNSNREVSTNVDGRTESEIESRHGDKQEVPSKKKQRQKHYLELAADVSGHLAVLRVPGTSDDSDLQRDAGLQSQQQATESFAHHESLSEYNPNVTYGSGSVSERAAEHSRLQLETERINTQQWASSSQQEASVSVSYQESLSEYNPDATCGSGYEHETCELLSTHSDQERQTELSWASSSQREATASSPYQESMSEYNPDATCGSGYEYETCGFSSTHSDQERQTELGWASSSKYEMTESFSYQESMSEYNPDATCGSGYEYDSCGHSSLKLETEMGDGTESVAYHESLSQYENAACGKESSGTDDSQSKLPAETETDRDPCSDHKGGNTQLDSCSQHEGEPLLKKSKPNPEVIDEQHSLPHQEQHDLKTGSVGDVEFTLRQRTTPEMSSVESEYFESITTTENQEHGLHSGVKDSESLSSEFEHMNLDENNSVLTDCSIASQSNQGIDFRESAQKSSDDMEDGSVYSTNIDTLPHVQTSTPIFENSDVAGVVTRENASSASSYSQCARPKTSEKVPRRKKHKTPKQNTKNAYAELAKDVAGDLSAMNRQMDDSQTKNRKGGNQQTGARDQVLYDDSSLQAAETNTFSLHASHSEREQVDGRQQASLTSEEMVSSGDVREQREDALMLRDAAQTADQSRRATSRRSHDTPGARAAAQYCRAQVEEQQQLIDNMGPELQALVIEMMQRDEEELGGGHVLHDVHFNPPVPPREPSWGHGESSNQGPDVQGTSQQPGGKKSRKGKKNRGHYAELAGIIAPELANLNAALMNGHRDGKERSNERGRTVTDHGDGLSQGAVGHSQHQERVSHQRASSMITNGARDTDVHSLDQQSANQGARAVSSRDQSRAQPAASRRQQPGNGNRIHGAGADSTWAGSGKENRRQRKSKEEDRDKSSLSQMSENMAASLQELNAHLEEQQRQQRERSSMNGTASKPQGEVPEDP